MKQTIQHTKHSLATTLLLGMAMFMSQMAHADVTPLGNGTAEAPYQLSNAAELYWFAEQVNAGDTAIHALLTADITLSGNTNDYMIGTSEHSYCGEFNGNGHTISGIDVTTAKKGVKNYWYAGGLFGCLNAPSGTTAVVKDLTVEGSVNISGLTNIYYIGGVIGIAYGTVYMTNIVSRVNLTIGSNGVAAHCGGVVASGEWFSSDNIYHDSHLYLSRCVNYGTLQVACGEICGGVIGYIRNGVVSDCLNAGSVTNSANGTTAGILGYVNSTTCDLSNCLNVGTVANTKSSAKAYSVYYKKYAVGTLSNLYYKSDVGGTALNSTAVSEEELMSGKVAWQLNGSEAGETPAWRQTIGADEYPVLDTTKGIIVHTTPTGLNSIVRPMAGTLVGDVDVYNFAGIQGTTVYGIEYDGTLAANHPYVFTTDLNYVSFVPSDEEVTDETETYGLTGVLNVDGQEVYGKNNTMDADVSIVFTATAMRYANPDGVLVKYGKCYLKADECFLTLAPVVAKSIADFGDSGATALEEIDATGVESEGKAYNLQGVEVGPDYKGIVIVNGQKTMRK